MGDVSLLGCSHLKNVPVVLRSAVSESKDLPLAVRPVLKQEISRLFGECDAKSFNEAFLSKHSNSIPHRVAGGHRELR